MQFGKRSGLQETFKIVRPLSLERKWPWLPSPTLGNGCDCYTDECILLSDFCTAPLKGQEDFGPASQSQILQYISVY
jgi:hypothetical protein